MTATEAAGFARVCLRKECVIQQLSDFGPAALAQGWIPAIAQGTKYIVKELVVAVAAMMHARSRGCKVPKGFSLSAVLLQAERQCCTTRATNDRSLGSSTSSFSCRVGEIEGTDAQIGAEQIVFALLLQNLPNSAEHPPFELILLRYTSPCCTSTTCLDPSSSGERSDLWLGCHASRSRDQRTGQVDP